MILLGGRLIIRFRLPPARQKGAARTPIKGSSYFFIYESIGSYLSIKNFISKPPIPTFELTKIKMNIVIFRDNKSRFEFFKLHKNQATQLLFALLIYPIHFYFEVIYFICEINGKHTTLPDCLSYSRLMSVLLPQPNYIAST